MTHADTASNTVTIKTYDNKKLGTISIVNGQLTASPSALQDIADSYLNRANGDAANALKLLDGWQNGYLFASSDLDARAE
jgi:hypothetical protein